MSELYKQLFIAIVSKMKYDPEFDFENKVKIIILIFIKSYVNVLVRSFKKIFKEGKKITSALFFINFFCEHKY